MIVLSLDCASSGCGVCVWQDGRLLAQQHENMERGQDARLMPLVQEVMAQAGLSYPELDRVAVTRGPGSFTGLRIGLAAARGIGLAANKPVIGIDRFAVHRAQQAEKGRGLLVVLESRREELYLRFYPVQEEPHEPRMLCPPEIASFVKEQNNVLIAGDAHDVLAAHFVPELFVAPTEPECVTAARLATQIQVGDPAYLPRPLYLRAPDVTIKSCGVTC